MLTRRHVQSAQVGLVGWLLLLVVVGTAVGLVGAATVGGASRIGLV